MLNLPLIALHKSTFNSRKKKYIYKTRGQLIQQGENPNLYHNSNLTKRLI